MRQASKDLRYTLYIAINCRRRKSHKISFWFKVTKIFYATKNLRVFSPKMFVFVYCITSSYEIQERNSLWASQTTTLTLTLSMYLFFFTKRHSNILYFINDAECTVQTSILQCIASRNACIVFSMYCRVHIERNVIKVQNLQNTKNFCKHKTPK